MPDWTLYSLGISSNGYALTLIDSLIVLGTSVGLSLLISLVYIFTRRKNRVSVFNCIDDSFPFPLCCSHCALHRLKPCARNQHRRRTGIDSFQKYRRRYQRYGIPPFVTRNRRCVRNRFCRFCGFGCDLCMSDLYAHHTDRLRSRGFSPDAPAHSHS